MSGKEILLRCREFVREQSEGEWDDKTINADAQRMADMVIQIVAEALAEARP